MDLLSATHRPAPSLRRLLFSIVALVSAAVWACVPAGGGSAPEGPAPRDTLDAEARAARTRELVDSVVTEVRGLAARGDTAAALETLLRGTLEPVPATPEALDLSRTLAGELPGDDLARILQGVPLGTPLAAPVQVAYARLLNVAGDGEGARRYARAALESGASGVDSEIARAIVDGRPLPGLPVARIGALLPLSGSPGLQRFAAEVRDGIEAAVHASPLGEGGVELSVLDTGGDPAAAANLLRTMEDGGTLGVLGPLEGATLDAALGGRRRPLSMVSPTVWDVPEGQGAVYSLGSDDRRGPEALAEWALSAGIRRVAVLSPVRGPGSGEAGVFRERFEAGGGSVLRVLGYEPGTTFFGEQMNAIRGLEPQGLVLPIPAEDVQAIAGQAAYFALDTLGVQLMGTGGWTDEAVLAELSERYLEGVVVATPIRPDSSSEGYRRFVEAYESRFQRTLVDPAIPALGYDAAALLLRSLESGARDPESVTRALREVRGLQGATGILSIEDGRVVRDHEVVCFDGRRRLPLAAGERPVQVFRPFGADEADEETGELPEGPGHPDGFVCPQLAPDTVTTQDPLSAAPDTGLVRRRFPT